MLLWVSPPIAESVVTAEPDLNPYGPIYYNLPAFFIGWTQFVSGFLLSNQAQIVRSALKNPISFCRRSCYRFDVALRSIRVASRISGSTIQLHGGYPSQKFPKQSRFLVRRPISGDCVYTNRRPNTKARHRVSGIKSSRIAFASQVSLIPPPVLPGSQVLLFR